MPGQIARSPLGNIQFVVCIRWPGLDRSTAVTNTIYGSTELAPLVFGVEIALCSTAAAKAAEKWYRGILEAAELFKVRWHEAEAKPSR